MNVHDILPRNARKIKKIEEISKLFCPFVLIFKERNILFPKEINHKIGIFLGVKL